ncbi:MAG: Polynucleotide adenylyltransferase [Parcubacteria group bacterium Gr01-1014_24]|nr:MAG: Polynucleotide adenylyltransferase [Parcubacteria group bacterium Gr01-1014_24]
MEPNTKNLIPKIPKEVSHVTDILEKAGFEAYLVGGCVRDLLMGIEPKDWDVTTNAKPEQIISLFEKTVYENAFGTVGVIVPREMSQNNVSQETLEPRTSNLEPNFVVEVTPYRIEAKYGDFRHPDEVKFSDKLEDDLKRRDFTVNAMAFSIHKGHPNGHLVDLYGGLKDIENKTLRAVGVPNDRFEEDALRMIRAVRFACQLNFSVSYETSENILKNSSLIEEISAERIRDELVKIIMSPNPAMGIVMLQKFGLLKNIIPELEEGIGCKQLGEHIYDVWDHLLHAVQHAADKNWPLEIRLAALMHDIGKPRTRRLASSGASAQDLLLRNVGPSQKHPNSAQVAKPVNNLARSGDFFRGPDKLFTGGATKKKYTFYGHEVIGARMAKKIMERLKFPRKEIELVSKLVRNHMFFSDTELITLSAVRRIITKVGVENIWLLMSVRECDRVGMKKKEAPYRLRKYFAMIEEALRDPISVGQLKINGEFMMKELKIAPGPRMGWILHALLEEVLDAPEKNTVEHLSELAKSLNMLGDAELRALGERGKEKKEELEEEEIEKLHVKHGVRK